VTSVAPREANARDRRASLGRASIDEELRTPLSLLDDLPLLIAVPKAAKLLGISRTSAYRLAASGELPTRRLGGRVYVVTAALRSLLDAA
jgi:excisionase family DNA binding protein